MGTCDFGLKPEIRKNLVVIKTFFKLADDFFCAAPTVNMFRFAEQSGRTRRENQRLVLRSFLEKPRRLSAERKTLTAATVLRLCATPVYRRSGREKRITNRAAAQTGRNSSPMDTLTRIRAFIDVVDAEGFSAAARRVGRSKALLSKYVRELEDELGALLLNRTTRQFSLTEAGHTYYRTASEILKEIDNLADLVRASNSDLKGRLRISAPRTFVDAEIGQSLIDFGKAHPELSLEIISDDRFVDLVGRRVRRGHPHHQAGGFDADCPQA